MTSSDILARHLLPGEALLWTGRPKVGLSLRPADAFLIPFSVMWAGFAVFWNVGVWTDGAPLLFKLWGLPFLVVGFYFTIGRFLVDAAVRRRLSYAVTDRRVLIVGGWPRPAVTSLDLRRLPALELAEDADGSGTIRFGATPSWSLTRGPSWHAAFDPTPQFARIRDAGLVHRMIQQHAAG